MGSGNRPTVVIDGVTYYQNAVLEVEYGLGSVRITRYPEAGENVAHSWAEAIERGWIEPA